MSAGFKLKQTSEGLGQLSQGTFTNETNRMGQTETCFLKNFYLNNQCLTSLATQMVLSPRFVFLKQNLTNFKFTFRGHCNHRCISDKATGVQRGSRQNKEQKPSNVPGVKAVDAPERISKNAVRSV